MSQGSRPRTAPPSTFASPQRLKTSRQFGRVFAGAERSADRFFTVLARPGDAPVPRLGLTVSRRAAKRAVDRNRLKRLARESFRHRTGSLPPWDFVVLARRDAVAADNALIMESLNKHFARLQRRATTAAR